jgi:hypothetical protein
VAWLLGVGVSFPILLGAAVLSGLPPEYRRSVMERVRALVRRSR